MAGLCPVLGYGACRARCSCVGLRCNRQGGDFARGVGGVVPVQPAAGCGTGDAAGDRRGGAARSCGLSSLDHGLGRHQLSAYHHRPRDRRQRRQQSARLPGGRGAAAVSRLPHGERGQRGGGDGARGPRDAQADGAERAVGGRDGLLRRGARYRDRAPAREQRDGADAGPAGDAGPVQRGRGDAHGRGAGAGAPRGGGGGTGLGARQPEDQPGGLRAGDRPSGEPSGGGAREPAGGEVSGRERGHLPAREPERSVGALPRAGGTLQH